MVVRSRIGQFGGILVGTGVGMEAAVPVAAAVAAVSGPFAPITGLATLVIVPLIGAVAGGEVGARNPWAPVLGALGIAPDL